MTRTLTLPWLVGYFLLAMVCWGGRPLWDPDEGRYAEASREFLHPIDLSDMTSTTLGKNYPIWRLDLGDGPKERLAWGLLQTGAQRDWLVPHLQGQPHLTKPPFTYWITAAGLALFGANAWGARFFLSLAFFGTILCVVELARAWKWSVAEARAAGLIYGSAMLPFAAGHVLTTDTFLAFWEALGVLGCWKAWRGGAGSRGWGWVFWFAFGMAFLTKGPPGWLPLIAIAAFALMRRKSWTLSGRVGSWGGFALLLLVSLTWFLVLCIRHPLLWHNFVEYEVVDRIATTEHRRNNPFYIYPLVLLAGMLPWAGLWWKLAMKFSQKCKTWWRWSDVELFTVLWFFIPFLIFTLAKSRMVFYVLPLFVPVVLWMARLWVRMCGGNAWPARGKLRVASNIVAVAWGLMALVVVNYPAKGSATHSQQLIARQLLQTDPQGRYQLFTDDPTNQSLTFYSGRRSLWLDRNMTSRVAMITSETLAGRPAALEIGKNGLKRIKKVMPGYKVLAQNKSLTIVAPGP